MQSQIINGKWQTLLDYKFDQKPSFVFLDPPYNMTRNQWDKQIDIKEVLDGVLKICDDSVRFVWTTAEPFTSQVIVQCLKYFDYDLIWVKNQGVDFLNAKRKPMRQHENLIVCSNGKNIFNVIKEKGEPYKRNGTNKNSSNYNYVKPLGDISAETISERNPTTIQKWNFRKGEKRIHPTQKPLSMLEWLLKTYTNENDLVLDFYGGSLVTAQAALNTNRKFLVTEMDIDYINKSLSVHPELVPYFN